MSDFEIPGELNYSQEDEWTRVDDDVVVIGITDYAQQQLGDIVFIELPDVGDTLQRGETFGTIESVKAVSDLFAPISGKVLAINTDLTEQPEIVNDQPYESGWLLQLQPSDPSEIEGLLDADRYAAHCEAR